jgi:uncharacterized membrane protein
VSDLIVVSFDKLEDARSALASMRELEHQDAVKFEDTAVVERAMDGKVHVKNELSGTTETGAVVGAFVGAFLTVFFPVVGIGLGALAGGAIGALMHTGVDGKFVKEVEAQLAPGKSALFLVTKSASDDAVVAALRPFTGQVIQTTLDEETEDELKRALHQKS